MKKIILLTSLAASFVAACINAQIIYNNDFPTNQIAVASRPETPTQFEIEAADDFLLNSNGHITGATFTGLVPAQFNLNNVGEVVVEIYRVFPLDSNVARTSGPPTFSTPNVPTRVNSPSDVAFDSRASGSGLTFTTSLLNPSFTVLNSVQPGGIHPVPGQGTGGNGPLTGEEVRFTINFTNPFDLPAGHYFFVPQVGLTGSDGTFYWLSATRPLVAPSTVFAPDLQSWTRDANLDPDWLRVGTDIVDGATPPTFNAAFSIEGTVPETASSIVLLSGSALVLLMLKRRLGISYPPRV